MKSKLGLITMISTLFWYWKHVELAKIRRFRCKTLKLFFSKQAQDSYYHGIVAATGRNQGNHGPLVDSARKNGISCPFYHVQG